MLVPSFQRSKGNNVFALKIRKPTADVISHHHSLPSLSMSSSAGTKFELHGGTGGDIAGAQWSKVSRQRADGREARRRG